jgi:hypothetical protein
MESQTFKVIAQSLLCLVLSHVFIWSPAGLLAGGPVLLDHEESYFIQQI